ncbi:hypothetical protein HK097_003636, partial [Rhizophlyctis rosea]
QRLPGEDAEKKKGCECVNRQRECDPDLCRCCGADDDHDEHERNMHSCRNQNIMRGKSKHTSVGLSTVHGRGLFVREPVQAADFVIEFKGAVISDHETLRRDLLCEIPNLHYAFTGATKDGDHGDYSLMFDIDPTMKGNKARYINNAHEEGMQNVKPVVMLVSGTLRLGFYAARDLQAGEELFFVYKPKKKDASSDDEEPPEPMIVDAAAKSDDDDEEYRPRRKRT